MGQTYFTSDLHFGHDAILNYTRRGEMFSNMEKHDQFIINTINHHVGEDSHLYILGDVSMHKNIWRTLELLSQLKARKLYLVTGNHETHKQLEAFQKNEVFDRIYYRVHTQYFGDHLVTLAHFPQCEWDKGHFKGWQLHGHSHGDFDQKRSGLENTRMIDVGWDASLNFFGEYRPFSFDRIEEYMTAPERVSHHRGGRDPSNPK